MIYNIIFDLDGVIVSTDDFHYQAWKAIANQEQIYFDREINHRLRGVSREKSLEIVLEKANRFYSPLEKETLLMKKNTLYLCLIEQLSNSDVLPGIHELLAYLKSHQYNLAIGSSSRNTKKILAKIGLINSFSVIVDGWDVKNTKPAPDIFLTAANRLYSLPENCAVLEDAVSGIQAAKAANMFAIAIHDAVKSEAADLRIEKPQDVIPFLERNQMVKRKTL